MISRALGLRGALLALVAVVPAKAWQPVSGRVSVFNEGTGMPYHILVTSPIHPGLQLGAEATLYESRWVRLAPSIDLGYLYHRYLFHGAYMGAAQGLDIKFPFGATAKFALGAAYLQTFSTRDELQFQDGEFVDRRDGGNGRFMPSTSLGLGYRFFHDSLASPQVFINYQTWFELPYSPGFIPVMAHSSLHLGFTFPLWGRRNGQ